MQNSGWTNIPAENLKVHVQALAGDIGERNVFNPAKLRAAADYIEGEWRRQGYDVSRQSYSVFSTACDNLEVSSGAGGPVIVVGAHYDSVAGSPGANDNASGVAALLELSRVFAGGESARRIRFVAFVNEEPPFFQTPQQGSRVYARACRQRGDDIAVMISLETMGFFSDAPGSQHYPMFFRWFYPDRGNFIGFISNLRSRSVMHEAVRAFRGSTDFPVECCATWSKVPGVDWSDHGSFWHEGYRAFMVTDTAPYRYAHYHAQTDTPDKVNYESLARVTEGLAGVVAALAQAAPDLERVWNWNDPSESEKRFRQLSPSGEVQTQIARALGLQRKFDEAHRVLDAIVTNSPRVEVRYLLERGRAFNSAGQPDKARPLFLAAWEKAQAGNLDFLAVDAAHMLGILDGMEWNEKALALAEKSPDPKARGWIGSLLNNIGWAYYDRGELAKALQTFERDLKWFEERGKTEQAHIARYSIGKTLRALGRVEEALALQRKLKSDGYVLEEIAECLLATGKSEEARSYFARAYEVLSKDEWLAANEPKRLERIKRLSEPAS